MAKTSVETTDQNYARDVVSKPANDEQAAQAFLEQHGRNLHNALDSRALLQQDKTKEKDGPYPHISKRSPNRHTREFIQAVEAYRDEWQDPRIRALSLRGKVSWDQVMQEVRKAEDRYQLAGEKGLRRLNTKATDHSPVVIPFLRMLPDDNMWLPAVGGALRIIFEVSSQGHKKSPGLRFYRPLVISAKIESTFSSFYVTAENVYIAVLAAIEGTIKWLNKRVTGQSCLPSQGAAIY